MKTKKGNRMAEFDILRAKPAPRNEQETVITYDREIDQWHIFTDNPVHARKWEGLVSFDDIYGGSKTYHEQTGELIALDGKILGTITIRKKTQLSEERKQQLSQRLKEMRERKS